MVYYVMNMKGKVIARSTVYPLEPCDYDVTEHKNCMVKLDKVIEGSIGDYRNATNVASTQIPDIDKDDIKAQLSFCFDLQPHNIDSIDEEVSDDTEISFMDDPPTNDVESTEFDKFLGLYLELPGDDGESKVLAKVKDRKRDHDDKLIGTSHSNQFSTR